MTILQIMKSREEHSCQKFEYILIWHIFGNEMQKYKKCDGYKLLFTGCLAYYPHCKLQQFPNDKENNWLLKVYLSCLSVYISITLLLLNISTMCFWLPEYPVNTRKYSLACNWYTLSPEKLEDFLKCKCPFRRTEVIDLYTQLPLPWSLDSCRRGLLFLDSPFSLSSVV